MDIVNAIQFHYVGLAVYNRNFTISTDVFGVQHLTSWSVEGTPMPSESDIQAWGIEYLRSNQNSTIATAKNDWLYAGFVSPTLQKTLRADPLTVGDITGEYAWLQHNPNDTPQLFVDVTGTDIQMTNTQLFAVAGETRSFVGAAKRKEWRKQGYIQTSTTEDIITAVNWAPNAPTGLTAAIQSGNTSVALTWTANGANDEVASYTLYQNGTAVQAALTTTSATVTDLTAGQTYQFSLSATDGDGAQSQQSSTVSVTLPTA